MRLDEIPVRQREDHRQQIARQVLAAGRQELRIRAAHLRNPAAQERELLGALLADRLLLAGPRQRRLNRRRIGPHALRKLQLVDRVVVHRRLEQRADDRCVRRRLGRKRHVAGAAIAGDLADARDRRPIETFDGQAAVVGIQVVDQDEQIARLRRFLRAEALVRARRPVQPAGTVVRARKADGRAVEYAHGFVEVALAVGAPADFPRRALRVWALRILGEQFTEDDVGLVVVRLEVEAGERVQRFLAPALAREFIDDPA